MATKTFTKLSTYTLPAWQTALLYVDGIYVDEKFFDENIPILGASINITAQPTSHARTRSLGISIRTYHSGVVSQELLLYNQWWPFTSGVAEAEKDLTGIFYGVGLNMLSIVTQVDIPTNADVIFTVNYELRVSY